MQKYLLLVDREEDILELQEAALRYFYGGQIVTSRSYEDAQKTLSDMGKPEVIISSLPILKEGLHNHLVENGTFLPLIATGGAKDSQIEGLRLVTTFLSGRVCPEELSLLVKSFTHSPPQSPTHIPIKLKVACEVASGKFDIYLKLSGTNFVKITNRGVEFSIFEAEKLSSKGITEVYLKASESRDFLRVWEDSIMSKFAIRKNQTIDATIAMECLEQVERISRAMGWSSESLKASQKIIREAIASLNSNERISDLLKKKFAEKNTGFSQHVGLLCYLSCTMCSELKMEDAREKLVMAALMHDLSVEEGTYQNIEEWNKQARNLSDRSPEILRYRLHPLHASQTSQTIEVLPPDVDQIILQHHEAPDGSGYPRGLTANRIHYLAAVFIIAEDLIGFLGGGEALETSLKDFLTWGENRYQQGNFKKIFDGIRQKVS
jgi:HD-GYP domain-containing protein (c-di-GMP phosphodiesterase class II)